jgi:hypothetical protein
VLAHWDYLGFVDNLFRDVLGFAFCLLGIALASRAAPPSPRLSAFEECHIVWANGYI